MAFDAGEDDEHGHEDDEPTVDTATKEERQTRAVQMTRTEPLTQDDFDTIRQLQLEAKLLPAGGQKRRRLNEELREAKLETYELMPEFQKGRSSKEERLASVMEGRSEEKYGRRKGHSGGTTNRTKDRRKNPQMIKHKSSARTKRLMSMAERNPKRNKKLQRGKFNKKFGA